MARKHNKYGKDDPERFIDGALEGDIGEHGGHDPSEEWGYQDTVTSNEMEHEHVDRKGQSLLRAYALDNVGRVYDRFPSSMKHEEGIHGGTRNLKHSIDGAEAPADGDVGAAGPVKHVIIVDH